MYAWNCNSALDAWATMGGCTTGVPNTFFNASIGDKLMLSMIYTIGLFILLLLIWLVCSKLPRTRFNRNTTVNGPRWFLYILFPVLCILSATAFFQIPDPVEHSEPIFIAVSIISNLLDNAIEACEKVDGARVIQAKVAGKERSW